MYEKSSAKLGEMKRHRGGKRQKGERSYGASVVRRWLNWSGLLGTYCLRRATAACWGTIRGSTWSDHGVRAVSEVASSREGEAALGD